MEGVKRLEDRDSMDGLLSIDDLSQLLGVPKSWLYERTRTGQIPHLKLGKYIRFELKAVQAWLEEHQKGGDINSISSRLAVKPK